LAKVKVLFVYAHNVVGEIVDFAEGKGEDPSHVAVFACGGLLEAIQPAVTVSPVDKYAVCKTRTITVEVPDIEAAEAEGQRLIGTPYGLVTDCVSGLIHDVTSRHVVFNGAGTANCSETGTRYLRAGGLDVLPGIPADCVTPKDLLLALEPLEVRDETV